MNRDKLKEVIPIFLEMKDSDDIAICNEIVAHGYKTEEAERISAFLPSAFCRIALGHKFDVEFPDTYKVQNQDGEFSYKEESIYKAAIELASHIYHNEPDLAEIFNSIVMRSSEFNVVNQALNEGAELSGAKLSAVVYFGYKTLGKKRGVFSKFFS